MVKDNRLVVIVRQNTSEGLILPKAAQQDPLKEMLHDPRKGPCSQAITITRTRAVGKGNQVAEVLTPHPSSSTNCKVRRKGIRNRRVSRSSPYEEGKEEANVPFSYAGVHPRTAAEIRKVESLGKRTEDATSRPRPPL
jgi:hypothetical protein